MKLSEHFTLKEMIRSDTATARGIQNIPNETQVENLKQLCQQVLQPLRERYGKPLTINSGFRCAELNKAVGGQPTSQHTKGEAADVRADNPSKLLSDLLDLQIEFDQAILCPTFLHISYRIGNNRKHVIYK